MINPIRLLRYVNRAPEVFVATQRTPAYWQLLSRYLEVQSEYPFDVPLKSGGSLTLASAEEVKVFWHVFVRSSYVLPERCETIIDCGANVGIFSVWAATHRPDARIIALEPFPETFAALEANIRRNSFASRVECARVGLDAHKGNRHMRTSGQSPNRKLVLEGQDDSREETVSVACISLAECLDRFGIETLDLLKMDIEGSEWSVLLSTPPDVLRRIRQIQLEYHAVDSHFGYKPEQLFAHLAAAGHQLTFRIEDQHQTGMAYFESEH